VFAYEALSRPVLRGEPLAITDLLESAAQRGGLAQFDDLAVPQILSAAKRNHWPIHLRLFVNVSPSALLRPDHILDAVTRSGFNPGQIVLEISEREPVPQLLALDELLRPFREAGMAIALDDYGAGHSGLNRVVALDPDYVKLDLNLVRDIDQSAVKHALVDSTVRFATQSGHLELIAEGIETEAELATLSELGVTFGQGYLLGRPLPDLHAMVSLPPVPSRQPPTADPSAQLRAVLTTISRLVQGISHGEGLSSHIVHLAARVLGSDLVALWSVSQDLLVLSESWPALPFMPPVPLREAELSYEALTSRRTRVVQTVEELPGRVRDQGLASLMIVPVVDRAHSWGLLMAGFAEPNHIRPDDIALAEGVARLLSLTRVPVDEVMAPPDNPGFGEPLFEAISAVSAPGSLDDLLAKVMEAALSVSGGHLGYVGILTSDALHCVANDRTTFDISRQSLFDPTTDDGRGPVGQVLQQQRTVIVQEIAIEPTLDPWRSEMLEDGIQAALGIPLTADGLTLGILKVYHSRKHGFQPGGVRRLEALALLAAAIIEKRGAGTLVPAAPASP
jgi:EAL domain-containing protein (putative c-di-GMP-specific phosphodiesterase class I)/GAF domain-containing protein